MGFKGKAIYTPTGKAAEYSPWACNFFTGCSNDCYYCYCKRGVMNHVWDTKPHLKKCFISENHAFDIFCKELDKCQDMIGSDALLFSFTTDPLLPETRNLTFRAMEEAIMREINVKILTKRTDWIDEFIHRTEINPYTYGDVESRVAFGFTLTGLDDHEPFASPNYERIEAMRQLHNIGFKTFASIEPVITPAKSQSMIEATKDFCDLFKVGLISGKGKDFYNHDDMTLFWEWLTSNSLSSNKIYLKDSFLQYFGIERKLLKGNFVNSDYNIFTAI